MSIKDLFKKIQGLFNKNKRLEAPKEMRTENIRKEDKLRKEIQTINTHDVLREELVNRGIDPDMLKGEMGIKIIESIYEKNDKTVVPLSSSYKSQLKEGEVKDWVDGMLKGINIDQINNIITIEDEESYKSTHKKEEKEFSYNKHLKTGKITIKEASRTGIGVASDYGKGTYNQNMSENVKRVARTKTMHVNENGDISRTEYTEVAKEQYEIINSIYDQEAKYIEEGDYKAANKRTMVMENGEISYEYPNGEKGKIEAPKDKGYINRAVNGMDSYISIESLEDNSLKETQEKAGQEYDD